MKDFEFLTQKPKSDLINKSMAILALSKKLITFCYCGNNIEMQPDQMILLRNHEAILADSSDSSDSSDLSIINIDKELIIGFLDFLSANYERCRYNYNCIPSHFISKCVTPGIFEEAARLSWCKASFIDKEKKR